MASENRKENFTVSSLAKYVGVGDRKTWRRIVDNENYKKQFKVNIVNSRRVCINTSLSKLQLIALYNDYLQSYIKPIRQLSIMQKVNIPKKNNLRRRPKEII